MKRTAVVLLLSLTALCLRASAADEAKSSWKEKPGMYAIFDTILGKIVCELFEKDAPKTIANFTGLAEGTKEFTNPRTGKQEKKRFYDGLIFHRVIPNFMIQGGDPMGTGMGGPGYTFGDEIVASLKFDKPGRLAMANSGPGTNGSQFFITQVPTPWLDGHHTIFGQVVEGMDVIDKIAAVQRGRMDRPVKDIIVNKLTIERVGGQGKESKKKSMNEQVLFVVAPKDFRDEEYTLPKEILEKAGFAVVTASLVTGEIKGVMGTSAVSDITVDNARGGDYAAVVFVGGPGTKVLFDNAKAQQIAKDASANGRVIGAICMGPATVANAGVLKGKKATSFESVVDIITAGGALYTGSNVETDGNIITASGPKYAKEFGQAVLAALEK